MFEDKQMLKAIVAEWIAYPGEPIDADSIAVNRFDMIGLAESDLIKMVEIGYLGWWDTNERSVNTDQDRYATYYKVKPTADGVFEALS